MMSKYSFVLVGLLWWTCLPAHAQYPFQPEDVVPQSIIIKYKETEKLAPTLLYRPSNILSADEQARLGITTHAPLLDDNHTILQDARAGKSNWGERSKSIGLMYVLTIAPDRDLRGTIAALRKSPLLAYAEPIYKHHALYVPNDPQANPSTNPASYHLKNIKAYEAWDIQKGNSNVVIGITDNEFDLSLSDLTGQDVNYPNLYRDITVSDNILNATGFKHGTHVATVTVGKANNSAGSAGVCFDCKMLPIKVAPDSDLRNYTHAVLGVFVAASKPNCKIVNMSWGRKGYPSLWEMDWYDIIVKDYDTVLIAAAGNDGDKTNPTGFFFPASYNDLVVSVGATDSADKKSLFSTYNQYVDLCAPGTNIVAQSGTDSGTSFASPIVAGVAGLIRAHYPTWTATQVRARLVSTTDNIYGITGNGTFVNMMGSGRLNAYRALTDPLVAINLEEYTFTNSKRNYLFRGMASDLVLKVRNHFDAVSNIQISLSTDSPHLTIVDGTAQIASIAGNSLASNTTDALQVQVSNTVTANTRAFLYVTYTIGAFSHKEIIPLLLNPGLANNNKLWLTHDDKGGLMITDDFFPELCGLSWGGQKFPLATFSDYVLWNDKTFSVEAGLMLATSSTKVSNTVRSDVGAIDGNFTAIGTNTENSQGTLLTTTCKYEDLTNNADRIGLHITQNTYGWNEPDLENAVVLEYKIQNIAGGTIDNLYTGIFTNWEIGGLGSRNSARWDSENVMGYAYEAINNPWHGGITCLTERDVSNSAKKIQHYAFDDLGATGAINPFDGYTKSEKFSSISGGLQRNEGGGSIGAKVANLLAVRLPDVRLGDVRTVAFAYVVAEDLATLKEKSKKIYERYKQVKTSATPVVTNLSTCEGGQVTIAPTNGTKFNFYAEDPTTTASPPLYTGTALLLTHVAFNQTVWVAGADSVFISPPVPVQISISTHQTTYTQPNDTLNLGISDNMTFTSTAGGATKWTWSITKAGGTANADITFLGGTSATSPAPQVKFTKNGNYSIKLATENAQGCKSELASTLFVHTQVTTGIEEFLKLNTKVYPNPAQDVCHIAIAQVQERIELTLTNQAGKTIRRLAYQNNPEQPYKLLCKGLPAGVYTLRLKVKGGSWTEKIVIQ